MSTRSKRAGTATPQPSGGTSTPMNVGGQRAASPLSPTRHSRLHEKAELQNLNDRLACYIDRVRNLETENARLSIELQTNRDTITRETTNIKSMYETELSDARRLLDETAREKAKLEIDTKRLWEQLEELQSKFDKKSKECSNAEGNCRMYESRCADLGAKLSAAVGDRKKVVDELNELQKEVDRLRQQLEEARKHLEDEILARVDLENAIQSLREEVTFKEQVHTQEINETRSRRQVEISEIDGRLCEQYEAKLQQSLQELRDQYETQMRANREEIELLYENKIKNLKSAATRNSNAASSALEEIRTTRTRIETLNNRISELEKANGAQNARIRDLEQMLDQERARHSAELANLDAELQRMRDDNAVHMKEYQDLMDIKVSLDLEIAAYDKMLRGEESRLNITPSTENVASVASLSQTFRSPARKTPTRGQSTSSTYKRKRTVLDNSEEQLKSEYYMASNVKGDIQILEIDPDGKYVKLHNKGKKEMPIGGWQIIRTTGANETNFKFHRSVKIDGKCSVTVWSSDVGATHEPPSNIVMTTQKWFIGENMKTTLINGDGEEVASLDRLKRSVSSRLSHHRDINRGSRYEGAAQENNDDLYHRNGSIKPGYEQCSLM